MRKIALWTLFACFFLFSLACAAEINIKIDQDKYAEISIKSNVSAAGIIDSDLVCSNFTETDFFFEFNEFGEAECNSTGLIRTVKGSKMFGSSDGLDTSGSLLVSSYNYSVSQEKLYNLVFKSSTGVEGASPPTLQDFSSQGGHVPVTVELPGKIEHEENCDRISSGTVRFDLTKTLLVQKKVSAGSTLVDWEGIGTLLVFLCMLAALAGVWIIYFFMRAGV